MATFVEQGKQHAPHQEQACCPALIDECHLRCKGHRRLNKVATMASGVADVHWGQDHDPLGETIAENHWMARLRNIKFPMDVTN